MPTYATEYAEVKALGAATDSSRTPEQTALATFYIPNPVEIFNRTFRTISTSTSLGVADQARLYAMLNLAGADALINCWDDKEFWHFWRPVTAIQSGADDGNSATDGDTAWAPFISTLPGPTAGSFLPTPPYPDQPSGYNCLTSSMMHTAKRFFGDKMTFTVERTPARNRAHVHPVHGCREGHDRCPRLPRYPLPDGGRRWCEPRQERRELGGISLLQTGVDPQSGKRPEGLNPLASSVRAIGLVEPE